MQGQQLHLDDPFQLRISRILIAETARGALIPALNDPNGKS